MFRRSTLIVLVVFVLLAALAWALQNPNSPLAREEPTPTVGATAIPLFDFQASEVTALHIRAVGAPAAQATGTAQAQATIQATLTTTPTSTPTLAVTGTLTTTATLTPEPEEFTELAFRRDSGGGWSAVELEGVLLESGTVEAALSQLILTSPLDTFASPPPLDVIGLEPPHYALTLTLEDGSEHEVLIGTRTVTGSGYYLQVDGGPVAVVNQFTVNAVIDLLEKPPLAPTPTPEPSATLQPAATEEPAGEQ